MRRLIFVPLLVAAIVLSLAQVAGADPVTNTRARIRTAHYEHLHFGPNIIVRVSSECPVVAPNTRRCYFRVDPTFWARRCRAAYLGWNGFIRVRHEHRADGLYIRTWEESAWCAFA